MILKFFGLASTFVSYNDIENKSTWISDRQLSYKNPQNDSVVQYISTNAFNITWEENSHILFQPTISP